MKEINVHSPWHVAGTHSSFALFLTGVTDSLSTWRWREQTRGGQWQRRSDRSEEAPSGWVQPVADTWRCDQCGVVSTFLTPWHTAVSPHLTLTTPIAWVFPKPFYRWGNWGPGRSSNSVEVTQLINQWGRPWSPAQQTPEPKRRSFLQAPSRWKIGKWKISFLKKSTFYFEIISNSE